MQMTIKPEDNKNEHKVPQALFEAAMKCAEENVYSPSIKKNCRKCGYTHDTGLQITVDEQKYSFCPKCVVEHLKANVPQMV